MQSQDQEQQPLHLRIAERLIWLLRKGGFEFAEFFGSFITLVWGLWVLLPMDTFSSSPSFAAFLFLAPEWVWGLVTALAGGRHLYLFLVETAGIMLPSLTLESEWPHPPMPKFRLLIIRNRDSRMAFCFINAFIWLFLAFTFWRANHATTAIPVYGLQALPFVWSFWRLLIFKDDYE